MSRPANKLNQYRSYSYYHVLALCKSSEVASELAKDDSFGAWLHPEGDKFGLKENSEGKYIVLINGSTDAEFVITDFKYVSSTAASVSELDKNSTSLAIEGEMVISEPRGIIFSDKLVSSALLLGIDTSSVIYVIKTFFIGYTDSLDPESQVDHISDVEPLQFMILDLKGSFTEAGGIYKLLFVAISFGVSRLKQNSKALEGFSLLLSEGTDTSLVTAMKRLEEKINVGYKAHYDCIISSIQAQAKSKGVPDEQIKELIGSYSKVDYEIRLSPKYQSSKYHVTNQPAHTKNIGGDCEEGIILKSAVGTGIEDNIRNIMNSSVEVLQEIDSGDEGGIKQEFRIHTTRQSVKEPDDNNQLRYKLIYYIDSFTVPHGISIEAFINGTDENIKNTIRENTIEFDYIYSGKNIDILNFDIEMNLGLTYIQTASISNDYKDQTEDVLSHSTHVNAKSAMDINTRYGERTSIPLFFNTQIRANITNNSQVPSLSTDAEYTLAKHASLELAEASVKITGNYRILNTINKFANPANIGIKPEVVAESDEDDVEASFRHWGYFPAYTKINIFMPRSNDDIAFFEENASDPYAKPFWYQGYYYIYGVEHSFAEGEFTQVLRMLAMPDKSVFEATSAAKKVSETFIEPSGNCFDSKIDCNAADDHNSAAFKVVKSKEGSLDAPQLDERNMRPSNKHEADLINSRNNRPEDVRGFSEASIEVQEAIKTAARVVGVNPRILAQIAALESSFKESVANTSSSASGLFQHTESTWMAQVRRGNIDDKAGRSLPTTMSRLDALDFRFIPLFSALGGAHLMVENRNGIGDTATEIYMGHFLGLPNARAVARAVINGNRNKPTKEILGEKTFGAIQKANASVPLGTPGEICDWAALKMANTLITGTPVTPAKKKEAKKPVLDQSANNTLATFTAANAARITAKEPLSKALDCGAIEEKDEETVECGSGKKTFLDQSANNTFG